MAGFATLPALQGRCCNAANAGVGTLMKRISGSNPAFDPTCLREAVPQMKLREMALQVQVEVNAREEKVFLVSGGGRVQPRQLVFVCCAKHRPPGHDPLEVWLYDQDAIKHDLDGVITEDPGSVIF